MGPEARLERACVRLAKKHGWLTIKLYGEPGLPDRLFLGPFGQVFFAEFKSLEGRLTKKQADWLGRINFRGHQVGVIRSLDRFKLALKLKP